MKKTIYLTFLLMPFLAISQVKEHRVAGNSIHQVADGRFELAALQLGVVGNNYFNEIKIGDCAAQRYVVHNTWKPIDGYKRTAVAQKLVSTYTKVENFDQDTNFEILANNDKVGNTTISSGVRFFCEIDLVTATKSLLIKYSDKMPKQNIDRIACFGPFVKDGPHSIIEIHPAEQVWWQEKRKNENIYHLYSFMDDSELFDDSGDTHGDFERDDCTHLPWIKNPMPFIYAIPFETKLKKAVIEYAIEKIGSNCAVVNSRIEKQHKLFFGNQLIATVQEPPGNDILDISYDNVGLNPYKVLQGDSVLQGFLIIKSTINKNPCPGNGGDVLLKVIKKNRINTEPISVMPPAQEEYKVKVTLEKISCLSGDDGFRNHSEELFGYIGVKVSTNTDPLINILPNDKNSPLLWSNLDENHLSLLEGKTKTINSSFIYSLKKNDKIILVADLEENDAQWDQNTETSDRADLFGEVKSYFKNLNIPGTDFGEDDDGLEQLCDTQDNGFCEKGVAYKPIDVKNLVLTQPITRKMYFGSGGTKIEVSFKIELIQKTDAGGPIRTVDRAQ